MNKQIDISKAIIVTERLVLRPFYQEDLNDFFEYASVPGVGEMAGWGHHENMQISQQILDNFIEGKKTFAITINNKVIGSLGIEKYDESVFEEYNDKQGREIGYVLSKDYWGQGLMPEAVSAVIKYLFEEENLDFIACSYFKRNNQSKRVQEKLGFKYFKDIEFTTRMGTKEPAIANILLKQDY